MAELPEERLDAGSLAVPRGGGSALLRRVWAAVYEGLRFTLMVVLGVLGVWALVLLFG